MANLARVSKYLLPYWRSCLTAFICLLFINAANLAYPQVFRVTIDRGMTQRDWSVIVLSVVILVIGAAIRGGLSFIQGYTTEGASQSAAYDMRNEIYDRVQSLSFSYHDQAQTGQLLTRITSDVEIVRRFIGGGLIQMLSMVLTMVGTAIILIIMNPVLGLLSLILVPPVAWIMRYFLVAFPKRVVVTQQKLGALNSILEEDLAGVRVVKAFAREDYEIQRYEHANAELMMTTIGIVRSMSIRTPLIAFIGSLSVVLVIWFGGHDVVDKTISIGEFVAFLAYLNFLMTPLLGLATATNLATRAVASAGRIFEVMDAKIEVSDRPNAVTLADVDGRIEFRDVTMRYPGALRNAVSRVSFVAEPGQTLAIVGGIGSGKSTIAHLIPRFYDPGSGQVLLDGHDIRDVTVDSLRKHIGVVLQETLLFRGSIRDNIAFGRPDATMADVVEAARAAQAHDFILEQPDGYETLLGETGTGLSGGQRQRIAIARALLLNPRILILDDSTSSVDAETEYQIQLALDRLIRGRTTVIIAQKMSSVRRADKILVVDESEVVAQGSHEELMETSLLYAEIVSSQLLDDSALVAVERSVR